MRRSAFLQHDLEVLAGNGQRLGAVAVVAAQYVGEVCLEGSLSAFIQGPEGSECVLSRSSELLFVEAIRVHVEGLPSERQGWLAGLRDEHVGRALAVLHDSPARAWSLDELAREVGLSRSLLMDRFVHFVGMPAMQYLARWRMQLAAERLRGTNDSLAEIAKRIGYGSESAFSRAFKRLVGVAPASFRAPRSG